MADARVIVALDLPDAATALQFADRLAPEKCRLKVGKALFTQAGPDIVKCLVDKGFDVFLDLKYHDIPNTVAAACRAAADLGVWMLNVHAAGGRDMLLAAHEAVGDQTPLLIGVTVLTSLHDDDLQAIGFAGDSAEQVVRLAGLCAEAGLQGVVASAQESARLRQHFPRDFMLVTPGIRPAGSGADDQARTMTPTEAIRAGSDYLVMGRPITRAADPVAVLDEINQALHQAISPNH